MSGPAVPLEIIARGVIIRNRRILVARDVAACWHFLPGGHIETGEAVEAALIRELREELDSPATITGFVGVVEYGYSSGGRDRHEFNLVFEAELEAAAPTSQESHLEFTWLALDALPDTDLRPAALNEAVQEWVENRIPFWRPWNNTRGAEDQQI